MLSLQDISKFITGISLADPNLLTVYFACTASMDDT